MDSCQALFFQDQRWNRCGLGQIGGKVLFIFLPFYPFTFKMFKHRRLHLRLDRQPMSRHLSLV